MNLQDVELLKKEIRFRCARRGMRELDLLFKAFVEHRLEEVKAEDLPLLRDFLLEYDLHIFDWLTGAEPVPEKYESVVFEELKKALVARRESYSAS